MKEKFKELARKEGFDLISFLRPRDYMTAEFFKKWLEANFHGEMEYMARHLDAIQNIEKIFDGHGTIIVLAASYFTFSLKKFMNNPDRALISKYAWGRDYHKVLKKKLKRVLRELDLHGKIYVDTGPILERELAYRAGFGWIGKNAMLINKNFGSYLFLSEVILKEKLEADEEQIHTDLCYNCTRCIDACPTGAIVKPRLINANLCIGYLTVEYKGVIPEELREKMGNWVFGCDICQEVCPYNQKIPATRIEDFKPREGTFAPLIGELLSLSEEEFEERFQGTPVRRSKYEGFMRNVIIAAGNSGNPEYIEQLNKLWERGNDLWSPHIEWAIEKLK